MGDTGLALGFPDSRGGRRNRCAVLAPRFEFAEKKIFTGLLNGCHYVNAGRHQIRATTYMVQPAGEEDAAKVDPSIA
jgi:hypothetical protein